jgi:hypothetical protein
LLRGNIRIAGGINAAILAGFPLLIWSWINRTDRTVLSMFSCFVFCFSSRTLLISSAAFNLTIYFSKRWSCHCHSWQLHSEYCHFRLARASYKITSSRLFLILNFIMLSICCPAY